MIKKKTRSIFWIQSIFPKSGLSLLNQSHAEDGGVGRHTVPPRTTKRRTTTNLKTKNNKNCQKIELYGSLTTKELKSKHSFRLERGVETSSWDRQDTCQHGGWWLGWARRQLADWVVPHLCADKLGRTSREQDRPRNPRFQCGEIIHQNLWL